MTTILKKEWTIGFWIILVTFFIMAVTTIGGVHPVQLPFLGGLFLLTYLFGTDERSKMSLHIASLPIDRKTIVQGRYLILGLFMSTMVVAGFLFNKLTPLTFPEGVVLEQISLAESAIVLTLFLFLSSLLLPIFYYFRYNIAAFIAIFFTVPSAAFLFGILRWGEGSLSNWLIENIFVATYAALALCLAILIYWLSCKLSVKIFEKKDLHA